MIRIALFRGINVGGKNILPMKELRELLGQLGATDVQTYIQSGNVVFHCDGVEPNAWAEKIQRAVAAQFCFAPHVILLTQAELEAVLQENPFSAAEPKRLQIGFLDAPPAKPDIEKLNQLKAPTEEYQLLGRAFYLHAPDGIGRSKLAAGAEKAIGAPMTVRNLNTVLKLAELAAES